MMGKKETVLGAVLCLAIGVSSGWALGGKAPTSGLYRDVEPAEAGAALLERAEHRAGGGSWELIAVGRVYYLSGEKEKGQEIFDRVTGRKPEGSDWFRIGEVYAEAGEWDRARECFDRLLKMKPKDDSGMAAIGAWHNIQGDREEAERLFDRAFARSPDDFWHLVVAAGSYVGLPPD